MSFFGYYALHTFKNQLKKLFKTWVLVFFLVCVVLGVAIGLIAALVDGEEPEDLPPEGEIAGEIEDPAETPDPEEAAAIVELAAGALVMVIFFFYALNADMNGSAIFQPADVNLLFPSPMRPQSVLMFRLATQMGVGILGSVYMLFQLPNLVMNLGLSLWSALALVAAWCLTVAFGVLIQLALYTLSATYPTVKRNLRRGLYLLVAAIAVAFILYASRTEEGWLAAANSFFNAPVTRFIPFWGWIKGFAGFAVRGDLTGALLSLLSLLVGGGLLIYIIWNIKADFYEDAMAKSEERAELMAAAQSEATGVAVRRKKDRNEKLLRDGLNRGRGANVYFWKTMYNRRRFAHLGFLTKTMETYIAAALLVAAVCRFAAHTDPLIPMALTVGALAFFRSLGNPLAQDTGMGFFLLIPESTWAKLFWSLMGSTACCALDVLPAMLLGAILGGSNLLCALLAVPANVSVDFYATAVGVFINLSVPVSAGKMLKQVIQIMFIYFGLLPDAVIAVVGMTVFHAAPAAILCAALCNVALGLIFFALAPIFIDPKGGKVRAAGDGDLTEAKKRFSRLGLGAFVIYASAAVFQLLFGVVTYLIWPEGGEPGWMLWLTTFAPMYVLAVPLGLLVIRKVPASPREKKPLGAGHFAIIAIIAVFVMYASNLVGTLLLSLLQSASGAASANPLDTFTGGEYPLLQALVMVILAPLIEEYVFRKQLIDRMDVYGERLAAVTSALMFGLFHGNLSQFFYAFALGLVLGYVYLKTGRLRFSVSIHMLINFLGGVLAPWVIGRVDPEALTNLDLSDTAAILELGNQLLPLMAFGFVILVLFVAGLVLFCVRFRRASFDPAPQELPRRGRLRAVWLNPGMTAFTAICLASIVLMFLV